MTGSRQMRSSGQAWRRWSSGARSAGSSRSCSPPACSCRFCPPPASTSSPCSSSSSTSCARAATPRRAGRPRTTTRRGRWTKSASRTSWSASCWTASAALASCVSGPCVRDRARPPFCLLTRRCPPRRRLRRLPRSAWVQSRAIPDVLLELSGDWSASNNGH